jgi:membrane protein YdbS with pleckstrin-like domain
MGQQPPSGWYEDPDREGQQRWWDGAVWTDHRRSLPEPPAAPPKADPVTQVGPRISQMLLGGEQVIISAAVHPGVAYLPAIAVATAAALIFVVGAGGGAAADALGFAVSLLFLVAAPAWVAGYLRKRTNHFALTDRRVVVTTGVLSKTTHEILIERVEGITVTQSLSDRLFGAGSLVVSGVGVGNVRITGIEEAFEVRGRVASWLESSRRP